MEWLAKVTAPWWTALNRLLNERCPHCGGTLRMHLVIVLPLAVAALYVVLK